MRIFGWAADQQGCGYYRVGLPLTTLRLQTEHETIASTLMPEEHAALADVILGQRVCIPGASATWQKLAAEGKPLVYEVDDDLWHVHETNAQAYDFFSDPDNVRRLSENIAVATAVTVTSDHLAAVVREHTDAPVYVVPNFIDAALLDHEREHRSRLTLGWAGSNTHLMDLRVAARPLRKLLTGYRLLDMHFIGQHYGKLIGRPDARSTTWQPTVPEYYQAVDFDIGIAPLADEHFNLSKSPIKTLEYAALGIPVVASNVGPYAEFVRHGVTGFLASTQAEWTRYLRDLVQDRELREQMGKAAREQAADHTIQANAQRWLDVFERTRR